MDETFLAELTLRVALLEKLVQTLLDRVDALEEKSADRVFETLKAHKDLAVDINQLARRIDDTDRELQFHSH